MSKPSVFMCLAVIVLFFCAWKAATMPIGPKQPGELASKFDNSDKYLSALQNCDKRANKVSADQDALIAKKPKTEAELKSFLEESIKVQQEAKDWQGELSDLGVDKK